MVGDRNLIHLALTSVECLRIILEFGKRVDIECLNGQKMTPLLSLVAMKPEPAFVDVLRLLLRAGANCNTVDNDGDGVLQYALLEGKHAYLQPLLAHPDIDVDLNGRRLGPPLHLACKNMNLDGVEQLIKHGADINYVDLFDLRTTPLISAILPHAGKREDNVVNVDHVVRKLVHHGADVRAIILGGPFPTALSAACLVAGTATIDFLLDSSASVDVYATTGRRLIPFAAMNGIENFEAILQRQPNDLLVADPGLKTSLHWAAQFGNAKTVKLILSKLTIEEAKHQVNKEDVDGWTPLSWASRPCTGGIVPEMQSEPRDYADVIRLLLKHGADPTVRCRLVLEDGEMEEVTLPQLARRCDADSFIIDLLQDAADKAREGSDLPSLVEDVPSRTYFVHDSQYCDICLGPIFGMAYKCTVCANFDACSKCKPSYRLFHDVAHRMPSPEGENGEIHELVAREGWKNYESRPTSPSRDVEKRENQDSGETKQDDAENGSEKAVVYDLDTEEMDNEEEEEEKEEEEEEEVIGT